MSGSADLSPDPAITQENQQDDALAEKLRDNLDLSNDDAGQ